MPTVDLPGRQRAPDEGGEFRWLMSSDVCKHCTQAACLDVPTGALFGTEFGLRDRLPHLVYPVWTIGRAPGAGRAAR